MCDLILKIFQFSDPIQLNAILYWGTWHINNVTNSPSDWPNFTLHQNSSDLFPFVDFHFQILLPNHNPVSTHNQDFFQQVIPNLQIPFLQCCFQFLVLLNQICTHEGNLSYKKVLISTIYDIKVQVGT